MTQLHQLLAARVKDWRDSGYPAEAFPALAEMLEYQVEAETGAPRFLRLPQLRALETYWYLRVVMSTTHIFDLYRELYPRARDLREALGLTADAIRDFVEDNGQDALWARIRTDDNFVRDFKLEALRESLNLAYPSYILALAMGAGKTILIGAIIATEFALAQDYPDGPFVQNALVFAPGKTILESLRELAAVPYDRILPPRLHKTFAASVKLTFTRDGEKDVPVIRGSLFNLVVTNTEKIRIQKETVRQSDLGRLFSATQVDSARAEVANLRLQAIASLPHLAVFSDEAHHTYGQALDSDLKRVRQTVDYLAANTNLVAVVNTTGTPYYQRQPLRDVVIWYGLSEGIRDNILKDLSDSIQAYDFAGDTASYVAHVVADFFREYGAVRLPNGAAAKLAIYFPQTDDLRELKPVVDQALVEAGLGPAVCLVNTSDDSLTKTADVEAFNRLNDPASPYRVILLVNKGTEGWNCPSLFACALARKLRTSNNFVLQAATRCLRQVPGNTKKARVYLSTENYGILDRQLQE
ncbi:MAG: restriction endonuclease subunit R, partial [Anaerolineales bacterium]